MYRRTAVRLAAIALLLCAAGACRRSRDASLLGTYRMGEQVQAGPLMYTVLESEWRPELDGGKAPKNRYLLVRVSMRNTGKDEVSPPAFTLRSPNGTTYVEVTEGLEEVRNWLGMFRRIPSGQTQAGYAIFDAPVGPYKLVVSDAAEIAEERHAHIDIPVALE